MSKQETNGIKTKGTAAIEAALADTRADISAGRVIKESAKAHVKRLKMINAKSSKTQVA